MDAVPVVVYLAEVGDRVVVFPVGRPLRQVELDVDCVAVMRLVRKGVYLREALLAEVASVARYGGIDFCLAVDVEARTGGFLAFLALSAERLDQYVQLAVALENLGELLPRRETLVVPGKVFLYVGPELFEAVFVDKLPLFAVDGHNVFPQKSL